MELRQFALSLVLSRKDGFALIITLSLILSSAFSPAQGAETTPSNPVNFTYPYFDGKEERNVNELRDPAVIKVGDTWYLTHTNFPFTHSDSRDASKPDMNSSPGIPLYSSKNLKDWKFEKWLVKSSELPDDCPYKHRFWAPEIHQIDGKFYLIFTADNWIKDDYNKGGKIGFYLAFVGVADKVIGPYENVRWVEGATCDTTLFEDTDRKTYAIMPFGDEFIQEVDLDAMKFVGERKRIVTRDNNDVGRKSSPDYMEGPWMMKRDGKYILFTAAPYKDPKGDLKTGYWTGAAVADHIFGPYKKQPQVFPRGHISVFEGPGGEPWMSYRGEAGGEEAGRLNLSPVTFEGDGSMMPVGTQ